MSSTREDAMQYWQRLRKDKMTAVVTGAAGIACLAATLLLIGAVIDGPRSEDRASPLYWALMLPAVVWITGLSRCSRWSIRLLRPALLVLPIIAVIGGILAMRTNPVVLPLTCMAIVIPACLISAVLLPRSLVAREGPDRR